MGAGTRKNIYRNILWAICVGVVSSAIAILISNTSLVKSWELKTYDLRMSIAQKSRPRPQNVVMFYVDENSLRHMEAQGIHWPWPRELEASVLDFCKRGGAKAVLFDIFFSEDSVYGVDDDNSFAEAIQENGHAYFVVFASKEEGTTDDRDNIIFEKSKIPFDGKLPNFVTPLKSLKSKPIGPITKTATGFGNVQAVPDKDGIYRRISLLNFIDTKIIPSVSLKIASDVKNIQSASWPKENKFNFGNTQVPLDDNGEMFINYYGGNDTFPTYPLAKILVANAAISANQKPDIEPSVVKDKVVIIGVAAPGLYDLKPTPLSNVYAAPEIHATIIENLLTSDFITPVSMALTIAITIAFGLLVALGLTWASASWTIAAVAIGAVAIITVSGQILFFNGVWLQIIPPLGASIISSFAMIVRNYMTEGRKKRAIKHAFGQYLSPEVVSEIARDPDSLALGGAEKKVTLFFSDIKDFTTISEKTKPQDLVLELNKYFSKTTKIIQRHGGTLDKYIGDAIMAFWGAPLSIEDHAARAVISALEIQNELIANSKLTTRIGIHTGLAVVGNIGSDIRFNYTAIGDTVNLASRLEGLNKKFGTLIIISAATYNSARNNIEARKIGKVGVKGRAEPIEIYEPLGEKENFGKFNKSFLNNFSNALIQFENGNFSLAKDLFAKTSKETDDSVSNYYYELCEKYIKEAPKNFNGVTVFSSK